MGCQPLRRQSIAHASTRHGEHSIGVAARPYVRAQLRASVRRGGERENQQRRNDESQECGRCSGGPLASIDLEIGLEKGCASDVPYRAGM